MFEMSHRLFLHKGKKYTNLRMIRWEKEMEQLVQQLKVDRWRILKLNKHFPLRTEANFSMAIDRKLISILLRNTNIGYNFSN